MADPVPADDIERIVGVRRQDVHFARAVTSELRVYVLHSFECRRTVLDLRECHFSIALDAGIDADDWDGLYDTPVWVTVLNGRLIPVKKSLKFL